MASRCLNKAMLIGNLTRDPELRYTLQEQSYFWFGNQSKMENPGGDTKDEAQFHRVVV